MDASGAACVCYFIVYTCRVRAGQTSAADASATAFYANLFLPPLMVGVEAANGGAFENSGRGEVVSER